MKRKIQAIVCLLFVMCMSTALAGCEKKEDPALAKYKIYRMNQEGTGLVEEAYDGEMEDASIGVPKMLAALKKSNDAIEEQPAIPRGVELLDYTLDDEKLSLYFDEGYSKMDIVQEVLCRAALVRSLTQMEEVKLVAFYVDGEPLTNKDGTPYGYFQADDFVQNTGSSINSYQDTDLRLYFANESGNKLVEEQVSVRYNSNFSKEKVVVERLMKGPSAGKKIHATIPKGTKLLGVSIKDGVCYLNFDEGLKNMMPGVNPEIIIYSIVNSVIENGQVSRVQISINGESNVMFQESVELVEPLRSNLDIVEEK